MQTLESALHQIAGLRSTNGHKPKISPKTPQGVYVPPRVDPRTRLSPPSYCICGGLGWVGFDVGPEHPQFGEVARCACGKAHDDAHERDWRWRQSGLGSLGLNAIPTFEGWTRGANPDCDTGFLLAVRWSQKDLTEPFLTLAGPPGTGKTHLAQAAALAVFVRGEPVKYVTATEFIAEAKRQFETGSYETWILAALNISVLVLDDVGREYVTDFTRATLHRLLDWRYSRWLPTLVTTNHTLAELGVVLGTPAVSRLSDTNRSRFMVMSGRDYRRSPQGKLDA